jgi:SAM-dependent methyltransferase
MSGASERTIQDFGEQFVHYGHFDGWYGSLGLLQDTLGPLMRVEDLRGLRIGDVGAGTGRTVCMMLEAGAEKVFAVEPSNGVEQLRANTRRYGDRVEVIHARGDEIPAGLNLDLVFSYGVMMFIPDPAPVIRAAYAALRPGGRIVLWLYGKEGNGVYLAFAHTLRTITPHLPHAALAALSSGLNVLLGGYIAACKYLPLPLHEYMTETLAGYSRAHRAGVIYDQLNPSYVKYYTRDEARQLVEQAGFRDVRLHHRHGYSWTVMGTRPG